MGNMVSVLELEMELDQDLFFRTVIRELSGTLEKLTDLDGASGFISLVGQSIGDCMNAAYCRALGTKAFSEDQLTQVLLDLKKRIRGGFQLVNEDRDKIEFINYQCPFGDKVDGRPSLCMMTSNVFGTIAAEHLGYAKVCLQKTIAQGHGRCQVVLFKKTSAESEIHYGREYFASAS